MCTQMLMHVIVHGGCMDTVRESALEIDYRKKEAQEEVEKKQRKEWRKKKQRKEK